MNLFNLMIYGEFASGFAVFLLLLFVTAPYGKHSRKGWGPMGSSRFSWLFMELPSVLVISLVVFIHGDITLVTAIYLAIWEFHYIYRTFVFPFLQKGSKRSFPVILVLFALIFNINNGIINGWSISMMKIPVDHFLTPARIAGLFLFFVGFSLHFHSDLVIRNLRKGSDTGYNMPMKGAFKWVSNPNYLGEIIEWTGWAVMTGCQAGWAFAFFTFCNLFPRAISNHKWYLGHFKDYPKDRKIIIPYLF